MYVYTNIKRLPVAQGGRDHWAGVVYERASQQLHPYVYTFCLQKMQRKLKMLKTVFWTIHHKTFLLLHFLTQAFWNAKKTFFLDNSPQKVFSSLDYLSNCFLWTIHHKTFSPSDSPLCYVLHTPCPVRIPRQSVTFVTFWQSFYSGFNGFPGHIFSSFRGENRRKFFSTFIN